jgi:hypothetical protein
MKKLVKIKDIPYIYIYGGEILSGELSEVANNILGIRKRLEDAHAIREKAVPNGNFTPLEQYEKISIQTYGDSDDGLEIDIVVEREETDEEYQKRLDTEKKRAEAIKKAKADKAKITEKRERALLETLKKKYE